MRQLRATGLLKEITPELAGAPDALWRSIAALDRYRARFESAPDSLTNAILAGTLLQPLGLVGRRQRFSADALERRVELGMLPIARRDVERLQQIIAMQPRLLDINAPVARAARPAPPLVLDEAITWLEIHGDRPDVVAHWRELQAQAAYPRRAARAAPPSTRSVAAPPPARRRRAPFVAPQDVAARGTPDSDSASGSAHEPVADAAHGQQVPRLRRLLLDVAPQPDDEVVDGARVGVLVHAPDVLEHRLARHRLAFVRDR